jgi:hypothetical protein
MDQYLGCANQGGFRGMLPARGAVAGHEAKKNGPRIGMSVRGP